MSLNQRPRYKAVSYLWDRPENKDHMIVNGHCVQAIIRITLLLRYIQCSKEDSPAILWIDLLSINQHDVTEKSDQVLIMPSIFGLAQEVLIYIKENDMIAAIEHFKWLAA
jgi:hypothetical protein